MKRKAVTVLVVSVLLANVLVAPVMAQRAVPETVLLDRSSELIGEVNVDGQAYEIHRIENRLGYASGLEVYRDGEKVTSEAEARAAFLVLAQHQIGAALDADDLETFRTLEQDMTATTDATRPAIEEVDATMRLLQELENETVDGDRTAWELVVSESGTLEEFNATRVPELRESVHEWQTAADRLRTNTTALVELLERKENGEAVDPVVVYHKYVTTIDTLETFDRQTGQLTRSLSTTATTSQRVATEVDSVPDYGEELAPQFDRLGEQLHLSSAHVREVTAPISEQRDAFFQLRPGKSDVERVTKSTQDDLMDSWLDRTNAAWKVYRTMLLPAPFVLLALGGFVYWRRR